MIDCVARVRSSAFPDPERVSRCMDAPEQGPRVLFFSGGTALRPFSRTFVDYTHRSIHLVTPFDSGGSSAALRAAFGMPAVGDLRNRLLSLADLAAPGVSVLHDILAERIDTAMPREQQCAVLEGLAQGSDSRLASVSPGQKKTLCTVLQAFVDRMPEGFALGNASIGNLALAGAYLGHDRDIDSAVTLFSGLVAVRGVVAPVGQQDLHLAAVLRDGTRVVGQHRLTGKEVSAIASPIEEFELVSGLDDDTRVEGETTRDVLDLLAEADLVCFPVGSFYTSVIAQLLPRGVGRAVASADCPKVYIANTESDPEQIGMSLADTVERIIDTVRKDAGEATPVSRILNLVVIDADERYCPLPVDMDRIRKLGVEVTTARLVEPAEAPRFASRRLCEVLVSLT